MRGIFPCSGKSCHLACGAPNPNIVTQKVDSEKRGKISIEEFKTAIRRLGVASTTEGMQEDEMFAEYAEHTGSIGPLEHLRLYSKRHGQRNGQGH